mmetsp:Transcript_1390/g.2000  ORF Transcript_1390/g.2000 Transcript_1390/m.2000 type:complete len:227 (-) Transcript_1390:113-793(-)
MNKLTFMLLHSLLKHEISVKFKPKVIKGQIKDSPYYIPSILRLSAAVRYFADGDSLDIMLTHGISHSSIFVNVWGIVDIINTSKEFDFHFPNHLEQGLFLDGFKKMSGANFDMIVGCIDGLLIWIKKPSKKECKDEKCGEKNFLCSRKNKFGLNLQAICDHKLRFTWIDIQWPGSTSLYMAWVTSDLCHDLESKTNMLLPGNSIVGDNAYVRKIHECPSERFGKRI